MPTSVSGSGKVCASVGAAEDDRGGNAVTMTTAMRGMKEMFYSEREEACKVAPTVTTDRDIWETGSD